MTTVIDRYGQDLNVMLYGTVWWGNGYFYSKIVGTHHVENCRDIIIARDYLVVKKDKNHSYRIKGYFGNSVLVECKERYGYQQIMLNGKKGGYYSSMPYESTRTFNAMQFGPQRVQSE